MIIYYLIISYVSSIQFSVNSNIRDISIWKCKITNKWFLTHDNDNRNDKYLFLVLTSVIIKKESKLFGRKKNHWSEMKLKNQVFLLLQLYVVKMFTDNSYCRETNKIIFIISSSCVIFHSMISQHVGSETSFWDALWDCGWFFKAFIYLWCHISYIIEHQKGFVFKTNI